jgi:hypothetical protein
MAKGKGGAHGYGEGDNVHSGKGSKGGATGTPKVSRGGDAGSATEKTHNVEFAKGGDTHMFSEQEANPKKEGITGKGDAKGPGDKFAEGGSDKMFSFNPAKTATAGITSAY